MAQDRRAKYQEYAKLLRVLQNEAYIGYPTRYGYTSQQAPRTKAWFAKALVKHDLHTGEHESHHYHHPRTYRSNAPASYHPWGWAVLERRCRSVRLLVGVGVE